MPSSRSMFQGNPPARGHYEPLVRALGRRKAPCLHAMDGPLGRPLLPACRRPDAAGMETREYNLGCPQFPAAHAVWCMAWPNRRQSARIPIPSGQTRILLKRRTEGDDVANEGDNA